MEKQKDIRLNKDYRTAYIKDFRRFLESKNDNPKYEAYLSAKTLCKTRIADAFKVATKVVHRVYKPQDVSTLQTLQKKYNTVDATAKDSCFYFAVVDKKGNTKTMLDKYNDELIVIKCGGSVLLDPNLFDIFIKDIGVLKKIGLSPIIVHGGGPKIKKKLSELNIESTFI